MKNESIHSFYEQYYDEYEVIYLLKLNKQYSKVSHNHYIQTSIIDVHNNTNITHIFLCTQFMNQRRLIHYGELLSIDVNISNKKVQPLNQH